MSLILNSDRKPTPGGTLYKDASAVPLTSPQTVGSGATLALKPPTGALTLVVRSSAALTFSETSDQSRGAYLTTANTDYRIPCSNGYGIYLKSSTGGNIVYYYFETN